MCSGATFAREIEKVEYIFQNRERSGKSYQGAQNQGLQSWVGDSLLLHAHIGEDLLWPSYVDDSSLFIQF
jgi:hypothetical protein